MDSFVIEDRLGMPDTCVRAQIIPRIIWQTFKTRRVSEGLFNAAKSWWDRNPGFDYAFFDDEACRGMIEENFSKDLLSSYDKLPPGAFRADLWRYCALYLKGGVYADMDTVCRYPLEKLIQTKDEFIIAHDANPSKLFNAFMCTSAKHPILETILELIPEIVLSNTFDERFKGGSGFLYDVTGPGGIALAVSKVMGLEIGCKFKPKVYLSSNGYRLRVLRKLHLQDLRFRRVMIGFRTILMCKYPGYFEDLIESGGSHWQHDGN